MLRIILYKNQFYVRSIAEAPGVVGHFFPQQLRGNVEDFNLPPTDKQQPLSLIKQLFEHT